jgi:hypothetical protein
MNQASSARLSLAGTELDHFHVCAFFNSRDEEYAVLASFYKEAVDQGEQNFHIVNPLHLDDHRQRLAKADIDTHGCERCGQLQVLPWESVYLDEQGAFNKDHMLAKLEQVTGAGLQAGFGRVRIMGNMDWVFAGIPGATAILEYEAEVNDVLARNRQPAVCVYDTAKLSGAMMMDILRTHPLTLIAGVVQENPFYTPPAEMLRELRARAHA